MEAQENLEAAAPARHLQLLFLGLRRQLLGDLDQPEGRLFVALRSRRSRRQGSPGQELRTARRQAAIGVTKVYPRRLNTTPARLHQPSHARSNPSDGLPLA